MEVLLKKMELEEMINSGQPVLIDFFSNTCEPCKWLVPILNQVEFNLEGKLTVLQVDVDKRNEVAQQYKVKSVPTLVLVQNGKEKWRMAGFEPAQELTNTLKKQLKL